MIVADVENVLILSFLSFASRLVKLSSIANTSYINAIKGKLGGEYGGAFPFQESASR